ncbi:unnamed protein product [Neospora caninum Liverpool]|uniref:Toxoplasma gondii family A protein n=1 Tax=Neospora caninum (strain Liverpool) TaxID=572307 RepID=F0VRI4_NEOCL|nr:uncharacterized protein NCLIV_067570 [Neospora caninum Liverpool]CBZ56332.1 unnamed protein product [Neospora caninum Liverpool]CEL71092.1 TPA: hypothetical protein BN1204_067570 [Neospora caninum Liverpool]|eukprot:XP_003886357.1 uncharacterized protein NCLIV_067570 [Neospora caninum Liverpool]
MERQIFRAACLILLTSTVLSCVASETSEQNPAANFTTTIPKEGLERDVEQVFYLGPSSTLQVIDETGKAKYLPEPSQSDDEASSGPYTAAYLFENGACDFTQTVEFKDAFQGYTKPPWVADEKGSGASGEASSGGPVRYTFTNPSAEYLGGGLSFCVRFKTALSSGSDSETNTSTTPTAGTSAVTPEEGTTQPGNQNGQVPPVVSPNPPRPGDVSTPSGPSTDVEHHPDGDKGEDEADPKLPGEDFIDVGSDGNVQRPPPAAAAHEGNQSMQEILATKSDNAASPEAHKDGDGLETGVKGGHDGARLRRLSETSTVKDAFLTIVVHSGAWNVSAARAGLSVFFTLTAALMLVS